MEELIKSKWNEILQAMKEKYEIDNISFKTWILPLKLYSVENGVVYILVSEKQIGLNYFEKKISCSFKGYIM